MPLDDESDAALLRLNAGGLLVVPLLAGPALFVYYVLSSQVGIVGPFLVVWPISVALPTVLQLARARYPYTLGLKAIDPGMLTLAQLRALTFIRSSEGHRFTLRAGGVLTLIVAAVSGFALLCPYPRTFFLGGGDYGSWRSFATVCAFPVIVGALASYGLHTDGLIYYTLRHWDRIQRECAPLPPDLVPSAFLLGRSRHRRQSAALPPALDRAPLNANQSLAVLAWLIGVPLVHYSTLEIVRLVGTGVGVPHVLVGFALLGVSLLIGGGRLWWRGET